MGFDQERNSWLGKVGSELVGDGFEGSEIEAERGDEGETEDDEEGMNFFEHMSILLLVWFEGQEVKGLVFWEESLVIL